MVILMIRRAVAISLLSFVVFFFGATFVLADEDDGANTSMFGAFRNREATESRELKGSPRPFELKKDRLEAKRLEYCEKHKDEIVGRSESLGRLVAGMLGKFDAILARVTEYYTTKLVPAGKTVSNYDALVADVTAKKAQVQTDLANAQADVAGFVCTGDNPKGQMTQYRLDMQLVKKDLQTYRTSIKNLIVAVKTAAGERTEPSPSASPI